MEKFILRKRAQLKDEIVQNQPCDTEYDKLASLIAAVLTLADEVRQARTKS